MKKYTEKELLKIAKRYNNNKRSYLLVNPLQAKHLPVSPTASLKMIEELGTKLHEKYSNARLVIGFAETATAIGAGIASMFEECIYIHTTRESISEVEEWIYFSEEHSHAVEQKLCADKLHEIIKNTETIIFVDDELSTGKTLINIVERLRNHFPEAKDKQVVIATIINRVSDENVALLASFNITCEQLLKLDNIDYSVQANDYLATAPIEPLSNLAELNDIQVKYIIPSFDFLNPRLGLNSKQYRRSCREIAKSIISNLSSDALANKDILVLGTEEFMYPAIVLGMSIEEQFTNSSVVSHSTTRSPISICSDEDYPIKNGYHIHSFYEADRDTYLYNIDSYDTVILITDSKNIPQKALADIKHVFSGKISEMYIVRGK